MIKKFNQYTLQVIEEKGVKAGEMAKACGCGCAYANSGGSSTSDNGMANANKGLSSDGPCKFFLPEIVVVAPRITIAELKL